MDKTAEYIKRVEVTFNSIEVCLVRMSNQMVKSVKIVVIFLVFSRGKLFEF